MFELKPTYKIVTKIVNIPHTIENTTSEDGEIHYQIETPAHKRMVVLDWEEIPPVRA